MQDTPTDSAEEKKNKLKIKGEEKKNVIERKINKLADVSDKIEDLFKRCTDRYLEAEHDILSQEKFFKRHRGGDKHLPRTQQFKKELYELKKRLIIGSFNIIHFKRAILHFKTCYELRDIDKRKRIKVPEKEDTRFRRCKIKHSKPTGKPKKRKTKKKQSEIPHDNINEVPENNEQ